MNQIITSDVLRQLTSVEGDIEKIKELLNTLTLYQVIWLINTSGKVGDSRLQLIPIPNTNDELSILRFVKIPEYGFMFWERGPATRTKIAFRFKGISSRAYTVACICCVPGSFSQKVPEDLDDSKERRWWDDRKKELLESVDTLCADRGIKVLFLRQAENFESDKFKKIRIREACEFQRALQELYKDDLVLEQINLFLDLPSSNL